METTLNQIDPETITLNSESEYFQIVLLDPAAHNQIWTHEGFISTERMNEPDVFVSLVFVKREHAAEQYVKAARHAEAHRIAGKLVLVELPCYGKL